MTFTFEAYRDIMAAVVADGHRPHPTRSHLDAALARHRQGPDPRIPEWAVNPGVPARMQRAAAFRMTVRAIR